MGLAEPPFQSYATVGCPQCLNRLSKCCKTGCHRPAVQLLCEPLRATLPSNYYEMLITAEANQPAVQLPMRCALPSNYVRHGIVQPAAQLLRVLLQKLALRTSDSADARHWRLATKAPGPHPHAMSCRTVIEELSPPRGLKVSHPLTADRPIECDSMYCHLHPRLQNRIAHTPPST